VIALREIAERTLPPDDLRERLIDSMQQNVEIDEPEAVATPMLPAVMRVTLGRDHQSEDLTIDMMSKDALLRAMKALVPEEHTNQSLGLAEVRPPGRSR
jgi:DNA-directed RNA polymerase subunit omega